MRGLACLSGAACDTDIVCASHSKQQPGLSLDFSAKGMVILAKFAFNPKLLGATLRTHDTILGDRVSSKKESINISERKLYIPVFLISIYFKKKK